MATLELEARLDNLLATAQRETANIDLFAPIKEREECPICMIPLTLVDGETYFSSCCGKRICCGCSYKSLVNDIKNGVPAHECKCAFCRQPRIQSDMREIKSLKKLMKKNNIQAFMTMAEKYESGADGVLQSNTRALEMRIRAAELGHPEAFVNIGVHHRRGTAVEQDMSKSLEYWEVAAKKGSLNAHRKLAIFDWNIGNMQTSIKHTKVAASAGDKDAMDCLMKMYKDKLLSKEDLTRTLRAFQASSNEMKCKDRDDARAAGDILP